MTYQISLGLDGNPEARAIRQAVFVEEQGFTMEFDDIDPEAVHIVVFRGGVAAATGRTFPKEGDPDTWLIGRVAVKKELRGERLGAFVVEKLEEEARARGAKTAELSAQVRAKGFYEKIGYQEHGEAYLDEYCPHVTMTKPLS